MSDLIANIIATAAVHKIAISSVNETLNGFLGKPTATPTLSCGCDMCSIVAKSPEAIELVNKIIKEHNK